MAKTSPSSNECHQEACAHFDACPFGLNIEVCRTNVHDADGDLAEVID